MHEQHPNVATVSAEPVTPFDDPECAYLAMPQGMHTFAMPATAQTPADGAGIAALRRLADLLSDCLNGNAVNRVDLAAYDEGARRFLDQMLGEGEVSALIDGGDVRWAIRESVFTGIWRLREFRAGAAPRDYLEVGPFPALSWRQEGAEPASMPRSFPDGLMNAPSLLAEVIAKSAVYTDGREEVLNLSLLPLTESDLAYLVEQLGLGSVSIVSKGYGDCRMRLTGLPCVWWVQYFNASDQMILNTLEITRVPQPAQAARQDLEDSSQRIAQLLESLAAA